MDREEFETRAVIIFENVTAVTRSCIEAKRLENEARQKKGQEKSDLLHKSLLLQSKYSAIESQTLRELGKLSQIAESDPKKYDFASPAVGEAMHAYLAAERDYRSQLVPSPKRTTV